MIKLALSSVFWGFVCGLTFPLGLIDALPYIVFYL